MFAQTIVKQKAKWRRAWIEWIQLLNNAQRRKEKEGGKLSEEIRTSCSYYFLVMRQCGIYQGLTKCKQSSLKLIDAIFVRVSQQSRILMFDIVWLYLLNRLSELMRSLLILCTATLCWGVNLLPCSKFISLGLMKAASTLLLAFPGRLFFDLPRCPLAAYIHPGSYQYLLCAGNFWVPVGSACLPTKKHEYVQSLLTQQHTT